MRGLILFLTLVFSFSTAQALVSASDFTYVACSIEAENGNQSFAAKPMILIATDKGLSRFVEIRTLSGHSEVQYQLLIEPGKSAGSLVVLQNFKIDGSEVSKEVEVSELSHVEIQQGAWSARCDVSLK